MPLAGVVVNRMQTLAAPALSGSRAARAAAEQLEDRSSTADAGDDDLAGLTPALLRLHADLAAVATRHDGHVRRFVAGHPGCRSSTVPASATDIHDLEGLRTVGAALASRLSRRRRRRPAYRPGPDRKSPGGRPVMPGCRG